MNIKTSNAPRTIGIFYVIVSLLLLGGFSLVAHAEGPVIRSGDTVGVEANQVLEGDFYGLGQTITISGEAKHDVYALGGAVTTNAPIDKDLVVAGGVVQVHGEVKDDVRIVGGEVVIANPVAGDVVVIGGSVHVLSTATIGGDFIFFGGDIRVDGAVNGNVYGTGGTIRIDAPVGSIAARAGESLTLGDHAEVKGNISYKSSSELVRAQGAVVNGTITRDALFTEDAKSKTEPLVLNVLILIFSSLTVFFLARSHTDRLMQEIYGGYGRLGLIGLGMLIALPIVAIILMASVIGFAIGVTLLLLYFILIALSFMCLPIVLGAVVQRVGRLGDTVTFFSVILGVFFTMLLPFIPFIGGLVIFLVIVMLVGVFSHELYRFFKGS